MLEFIQNQRRIQTPLLEHILQPQLYPNLYRGFSHLVHINDYPPRGDNKEGWDDIDLFGWPGYPMQIKLDFLCRDSILAAPLAPHLRGETLITHLGLEYYD